MTPQSPKRIYTSQKTSVPGEIMAYTANSWLGVKDDSTNGLFEAVVATPSTDFWHIDVMIKGDLVEDDTVFKDPEIIKEVQNKLNDSLKDHPGRIILKGQLVDTHLMVDDPASVIPKFIPHSDYLSFHIEAMDKESPVEEARKLISLIKGGTNYRGQSPRAGIAFNPGTEVEDIKPLLPDLDYVLVMSVVPGKGGQKIQMEESIRKVSGLKDFRTVHDLQFLIEMDGGIKVENSQDLITAGVDILVSGTGIYQAGIDPDLAVQQMKTVYPGKKVNDIVPIASDHSAMQVKKDIGEVILEMGKAYIDMGPPPLKSADFPLYAAKVARLLSKKRYDKGIVSCTTGQGMIETVSRFPGVRAGLILNPYHAKMTVVHNAINCLVIPQMKDLDTPLTRSDVKAILEIHYGSTPPSNPRYIDRVKMVGQVARRY